MRRRGGGGGRQGGGGGRKGGGGRGARGGGRNRRGRDDAAGERSAPDRAPQEEPEEEDGGGLLATLGRALFGGSDEEQPARRERRRARRKNAEGAGNLREDADDEDFHPADTDDLDELAARFERKTKVRLLHKVPVIAEGPSERGPVERAVARIALPTVEEVLMFYPESVRGNIFRELHIFGKFRMRGKPFLGCAMAKKRTIQLAIRPKTKPISLKTTMHHEIAHLIELHPKFPVKRWMAISEGHYTGKGHRDDEGKASRADLLALGFVSKYASKNRHEDFAELAEVAFTKPRKVLKLASQHDAIARKLDIVSDAYEALVPELQLPWER